MSSSDWADWYDVSPNTTISTSTEVAAGAEDSSSLFITGTESAAQWRGWSYIGPDQPTNSSSRLTRISAAVRGDGSTSGRFAIEAQYGLMMMRNAVTAGGVIADGSIDGVGLFIDQIRTNGLSSVDLRPVEIENDTIINLQDQVTLTIPIISNAFVQYEMALLTTNTFSLDGHVDKLYMYARYNNGSALSVPGSASWTAWTQVGRVDRTLNNGAYFAVQSNAAPTFGYRTAGTVDDTFNSGLYFDDVRVKYGTAISP